MPIKIPSDLPAFNVLRDEGVMVMDDFKANRQDIRPLKIGLLNLMPKKIQTENQFYHGLTTLCASSGIVFLYLAIELSSNG